MEAIWFLFLFVVFGYLIWQKSKVYEPKKIVYKGYKSVAPRIRNQRRLPQDDGEFVILGTEIDLYGDNDGPNDS